MKPYIITFLISQIHSKKKDSYYSFSSDSYYCEDFKPRPNLISQFSSRRAVGAQCQRFIWITHYQQVSSLSNTSITKLTRFVFHCLLQNFTVAVSLGAVQRSFCYSRDQVEHLPRLCVVIIKGE